MYRSTYSWPLALVGGEWSASRPGHFASGERAPGTHWIGGWVGPRTGLDAVETLPHVIRQNKNSGAPGKCVTGAVE
jgi:hypothetical protein